MTGLHIPGIPTRPNSQAARKHNGPVFKTIPKRLTYREVGIPHSFSSSAGSSASSSSSSSSSTYPRCCSYTSSSIESVPRPAAAVPRSSTSRSTRPSPRVVSRSRPQSGEVSRPCAPIPPSRFSTLSNAQRLLSPRSSGSISTTFPHAGLLVIPRTRPRAGDGPMPSSRYSTRSSPPPRPSGPIPWSRGPLLSTHQSLRRSVGSPPSSRYLAPVISPTDSTLSKRRHLYVSIRSSRTTSSNSTRSDSFPSARCFISAALKAAISRSSPDPQAPPVSVSVSAGSSSTASTRSGPLLSSPPIPTVRFGHPGNRLAAAPEVARRRQHAQLCSNSSSASIPVSSSHGSKDRSARTRAYSRQNAKSSRSVKFGGSTVHEVNRWIHPGLHSQRDPPTVVGKLVGWSVTPLEKPEDDECSKYTTYKPTHSHSFTWNPMWTLFLLLERPR
ncbi:hypothetical protein I7I50_08164 [Histoplasma capsulatum G186AR]|uniref:Uncharacterized protein n=1 Tax=Ajellomyces capsulatus TaxID=5037 RepID=A0A8H7YKA4_AJECA|nr:hypothetical protein I7I52_08680 [Histoplasma capsulatum]QSS68675.1 hypothetical protein I7I50_08164 [Histoplasma capsulatum G186AR]